MGKIIFRWDSDKEIPEELYDITKQKIGYSRLNGNPIYSIEINLEQKKISELLYTLQENTEELKPFINNFKILKLLNKKQENDIKKLSTFMYFYNIDKNSFSILEYI